MEAGAHAPRSLGDSKGNSTGSRSNQKTYTVYELFSKEKIKIKIKTSHIHIKHASTHLLKRIR